MLALLDNHGGASYPTTSRRYGIPTAVLHRHYKGEIVSSSNGRMPRLSEAEEREIADNICSLGEYGMAFNRWDLRQFVKYHLDRKQIIIDDFKENRPGIEWTRLFLNRQKDTLSPRICQNIGAKRFNVSRTTVDDFFQNLAEVMRDVSPECIVNYDETNISDSPGGDSQLFKRGSKRSYRTMNSSKVGVSMMYSVSANGDRLRPYVVYKAKRVSPTWVVGGNREIFYNATPSGWFDSPTFEDWFTKVALPYFRNLNGNKVIIGDNVPSHININVIQKAEEQGIKFIFLPPNTTHFLQPLDVSVFRTLKMEWRKCLTTWKQSEGRMLTLLPKWAVPQLLHRLENAMVDKWRSLAKAGFNACGIYPLNPNRVVSAQFPNENHHAVDRSLIAYLEARRETNAAEARGRRGRRGRVQVPPGRSVCVADIEETAAAAAAAREAARGRSSRGRRRGGRLGRGRQARSSPVRDAQGQD